MREDYSADGTCWDYFPHDHARSRTYRWGEDGLLGICDRQGRLCFGLALWNGADPILKERLFGLTGPEGNHGEDVKEQYFYLDSTPTHSYMKALYKYPQREFPYAWLVDENRRRGKADPEFELADTGAFDERPLLRRVRRVRQGVARRHPHRDHRRQPRARSRRRSPCCRRSGSATPGPGDAPARATRSVRRWPRPAMARSPSTHPIARQLPAGGRAAIQSGGGSAELVFTENETNTERLFGSPNATPYVKDAFHDYVVAGRADRVNPERRGTKAAAVHRLIVPAGGEIRLRCG